MLAVQEWQDDAWAMGERKRRARTGRATQRSIEPRERVSRDSWNKEQAELLRRIALAGGSCAADECKVTALDALIETGFVRVQGGDRVALTDTGLARARELRSPPVTSR